MFLSHTLRSFRYFFAIFEKKTIIYLSSVQLCLWTKNFLKIPDQSERDIQIPLEITSDPTNASATVKVNAPIDVPSSGAGATQGPRQNTRKEKKPGVSLRETEREIEIPLQITSDPTNPSASGKVNAPIGVPSSAAGTTQGPGQNTRKEKEPGISLHETEREIQILLEITSDPTNASTSGKVKAPIGVPSSAAGTTQGPGQNTRKENEPGVSSREASPPERDEGRICNDDFFIVI